MPRFSIVIVLFAITACSIAASGQQQGIPPAPPAQTQPPQPPAHNVIAANVNGQAIPELAVYRALVGIPPTKHAEYRTEILNYLVDNALLDQYLDQMKIDVEAMEIDKQFEKVKAELQAKGKKLDDMYNGLFLTESDLRTQIRATLRWDKFIQQYGSEATLKQFFEANKAIFDGSAVRAKHILISVPPGDAKAPEQAKTKIALLKTHIETQVNQGLASAGKLDNLELQKLKMKLLEKSFSEAASKESQCPTKDSEGELGWFPRVGGGRVSEAFAKAAFMLKPWELSEPVATEYGYHLILCLDHKAGTEPMFDQIRGVVRDVYADKMREAVVARMRPTAKIVINGQGK